ncbi:MAG: tRNA pseudouridine(13) synthase TruD [Candidatus Woesearchaeota archaeon]
MYKIKQNAEDFRVAEISNVALGETGRFSYFRLVKRDYTTEGAIQKLSAYYNLPRRFFGYAGNKDRKAITEQICSVKGRIRNIALNDLAVEVVGYGDNPVSLGDLIGNRFEIVVRNVDHKPKPISRVVNFFGKQRFGMKGNNHAVGLEILRRNFKGAVELVSEDKAEMNAYLKKHPKDYIGALRLLPKKILTMYVNAYQSYVWNECARQLGHSQNFLLPIVGFGTEYKDDKVEEICENMLEKDGICLRDFVINEMPELSSEGGGRALLADISELGIGELAEDELNKGMKKVGIGFCLPKGSYATVVIKELFR